jgi:hypothetical protein
LGTFAQPIGGSAEAAARTNRDDHTMKRGAKGDLLLEAGIWVLFFRQEIVG